MINLNAKNRRYLRSLAHSLKPVVMIGQSGLTNGVIEEINLALEHHELIKVKIGIGDPGERSDMTSRICGATQSVQVQNIGKMAIIYRPSIEPTIKLHP